MMNLARVLIRTGSAVLPVFTLAWALAADEPPVSAGKERLDYAIVIHGGAGSSPKNFSREQNLAKHAALERVLKLGKEILEKGGASLDAVEDVIRELENDPLFNAGKGAVFNAAGGHELDASIMDGSNKACGAVAGVSTVKNPISLARLVMTETRHVLLATHGAEKFAAEMGVDLVEPEYFSTDHQRRNLRRAAGKPKSEKEEHKGTVGCVALDRDGNLASGTSTGGLTNKKFGRVGDSPIVGAGTYANNASCAVSCTGIGEHFIRHAVAYDISARMLYQGADLQTAVGRVIHKTLEPGDGGVIALDRNGAICMDYNTKGMACAAADSSGRFEVKWEVQKEKESGK